MEVIKRDGSLVPFDKTKISAAIIKAMKSTDKGVDTQLAEHIADQVEGVQQEQLSIEMIQDLVEEQLMKSARTDVAKNYIRYRYKREEARNTYNDLDSEIMGLKDLTSDEVRNNANKDGSKLQTYRAMMADVACINFAKRKVVPKRFMDEHQKSIYIHDFNYIDTPFFNCCLVNWIDCLQNGLMIANASIETPKSLATAIALLSQIVAHVSSNCYGGVTLPELTTGLTPYMKKSWNKHYAIAKEWIGDDEQKCQDYAWQRLTKETYDACQSMEYEIQTLTNSRGEVPFITLELNAVDLEADDFDRRCQEIFINSYLDIRTKGLTGGLTPVFPKLVMELKRGNNLDPGDPYYAIFKKAVKCSSLRLYPDFLMHDKLVEVTGGFKAPMGCRSFLPEYRDEQGQRKTMGRFNQGVCSINLPRLAIMAEGDEARFYELLDQALDLTRDVLMFRHNKIKGTKAKQAPVLYQYGAIARMDGEEVIDPLLFGGYSTISIGYVGLHNALMALYGHSYDDPETLEKGIAILNYLRAYCDKCKQETNIGFSLYSTPAETLATKFCKQDIQDFGLIEGVNDKGYYENSFHYPSDRYITPFDKIDTESCMSFIPSGGAIDYVEFGNMIHNVEALEQIIRYAYDKVHYFGVNVSSDRCFKCGYVGEMKTLNQTESEYECPQCGNRDNSQMSVVRRICGYLGSLSERPTVDNKMKEINSRVKHFKGVSDEL